MKISELIASTKGVPGRGEYAHKPFGEIFASNKEARILGKKENILEVSMLIKAVTDYLEGHKLVAAHKVMIRISGVNAVTYHFDELVEYIRTNFPKYASSDDYKDSDLVKLAMNSNRDKGGNIFFPDKTLFSMGGAAYAVVENKIPDNSRIRVYCSCSDYYWTFLYYNMKQGINLGSRSNMGYAGKYYPVSVEGREARRIGSSLRNPKCAPGMCKHLMLLLSMFMDEELVTPTSNSSKSLINHYTINISRFQKAERINPTDFGFFEAEYTKSHRQHQRERRGNTISANASKYGKSKKHYWKSQNRFNRFGGSWKSK